MDSIFLHFFPSSYPGAYSRSSSHPRGVLPSRNFHGSFHGMSSSLQAGLVPFHGVVSANRLLASYVASMSEDTPSPFLALSPPATILRRHELHRLSIYLISHHDFPPYDTLVMYWLYFSTIVEHTIHDSNTENRWRTPPSPKVTSITTTGVHHCHHEAGAMASLNLNSSSVKRSINLTSASYGPCPQTSLSKASRGHELFERRLALSVVPTSRSNRVEGIS